MPEFKAFFEQLATFCRVVLVDEAGVGLSDPVPHVRLLENRAAEIEAVMDAAGFGQAVLFALGEAAAIVFATTRPERTRALILSGTYSFTATLWDEIDRDPAELRVRFLPEFGEDYMPSVEQITRLQEMCRAVLSGWGSGAAAKCLVPSFRSIRHLQLTPVWCAVDRAWSPN